jgi:hypothetical protein
MRTILIALFVAVALPAQAEEVIPYIGFVWGSQWGIGGTTNRWVTAADVDGDGKTDVVMYESGSGYLSVRRGLGPNRLFADSPSTYFSTGGDSARDWFLMADVNGDGKSDAILYDTASGLLVVARGNAGGTFTSPTETYFSTGGDRADDWFLMADVNKDGRPDAILYDTVSGFLVVARANSDGTFTSPTESYFGSGGSPTDRWFTMADVDGDGRADAVLYQPASGYVSVARSNGDGTFTYAAYTHSGNPGGSPADRWFAMVDVNGDGKSDAVLYIPESGYVNVMLSRGDDFTFDPPQASYLGTGGSPQDRWFVMADVDGDGFKDVVLYAITSAGNQAWIFSSGSNNGNGTFAAAASQIFGPDQRDVFASPENGWLIPGNFRGDGKHEIVVYKPTAGWVTRFHICRPSACAANSP